MSTILAWFENRLVITIGIAVGIIAALIIGLPNWRRFVPWCKANPIFVSGFGSGACAGVFVLLLFGAHPSDAIAGLLGAFAGIVAAVGGGLWLWQVQDKNSVHRTLAAVENSLGFLISGFNHLRRAISRRWDFSRIASLARVNRDVIGSFRARVHRFESRLIELDFDVQTQFSRLEFQLEQIDKRCEKIAHEIPTANVSNPTVVNDLRQQADTIYELVWTTRPMFEALAPSLLEGWPTDKSDEGKPEVVD